MVSINLEIANDDLRPVAEELDKICDMLADRMTKSGPDADKATTTYVLLKGISVKVKAHRDWLRGQ